MSIRPISSVSFKSNCNNVNFEGKRKESKMDIPNRYSSMLKAIPVATLIAMSPLNSVNAQSSAAKEKIVDFEQYDETKKGLGNVILYYISTDNNDNNAEILRYSSVTKKQFGLENPIINYYTTNCDVSVLKTVHVTSDFGNSTEYYVTGPGKSIIESNGKIRESQYQTEVEVKISPEMYNYLKGLLGNMVEYKTESNDRRYLDSDY